MFKLAWLLLIISCGSYAAEPSHSSSKAPDSLAMEYRYWDLGASPKRDDYQYNLLKLALEKSKLKYGDYKLVKVNEKFTSLRATREVSRGEIINIEASPYKLSHTLGTTYSDIDLITSKISILKNLLGYRVLVVKKDRLEAFKDIPEAKLKLMTAGQAQDWSDVSIYNSNNYKVDSNANFNNLMAMLAAGRVDYVPLSIIEADSIIKQFPRYQSQLAIVPKLFIYYPFPVHFNTSIFTPKLAERLEYGLELAKKDGSFDTLFNKHFLAECTAIQDSHSRVFRLKNPNIPADEE